MGKISVIIRDAKDSSDEGRQQLKQKMVDTLGLSESLVDMFFSRLPAVVRYESDRAKAESLCLQLDTLGAESEISENGAITTASELLESQPPTETAVQETTPEPAEPPPPVDHEQSILAELDIAETPALPPAQEERKPVSLDQLLGELEAGEGEAPAKPAPQSPEREGLVIDLGEPAPKKRAPEVRAPLAPKSIESLFDLEAPEAAPVPGPQKATPAPSTEELLFDLETSELEAIPGPSASQPKAEPAPADELLIDLPVAESPPVRPAEDDIKTASAARPALEITLNLEPQPAKPAAKIPSLDDLLDIPEAVSPQMEQEEAFDLTLAPVAEDRLEKAKPAKVEPQTASRSEPAPVQSPHPAQKAPSAPADDSLLSGASAADAGIPLDEAPPRAPESPSRTGVLLAILGGLLVILAGLFIITGGAQQPQATVQISSDMIETLLLQQQQQFGGPPPSTSSAGPTAPEAAPVLNKEWTASFAEGKLEGTLRFAFTDAGLFVARFDVQPPQPPPLTALDKVKKKKPPLWLSQILFVPPALARSESTPAPESGAVTIEFTKPAFAYFRDDTGAGRTVVRLKLKATLDIDARTVTGTYEATNLAAERTGASPENIAERGPQGRVDLLWRGSINAACDETFPMRPSPAATSASSSAKGL